jgi:hypothetical protein
MSKIRLEHKNIFRISVSFVIVFFVFSFFANFSQASTGVPKIISFQGRLLNSSGSLLGGTSGTNYCYKFSLYDAPTAGSKVWPTVAPSTMTILTREGVFNAGIGDVSAGGDTLDYDFQSNNTIYVDVQVAAQVASSCVGVTFESLTPRPQVVSSAYAINSGTVGGFVPSQSATGNQIPVLNSGALTIPGILTASSYTGVGAVTISSGGSSGLTLDSASGRTTIATGDFLKTSVAGVSGAAAGDIWYDSTANKYKVNENGTTKTLCNTTDAGCGAGGGSQTPWAQNVDAANFILSNIGNAGTDFIASTGGLTLAGLLTANGGIDVATISPIVDSTTGFKVTNVAGTTTSLTFDTTNNRVQIGTGAGSATPGLLVLDTKSTTGDPVSGGVNGSMYYNSADLEFRCFRNGAWENCGARQDTQDFLAQTSDPSTPPAGEMYFYSKNIASRMIPKIKGPSGLDTPLQVAFWQNNITMWNPTTATAGVWLGTVGAGAGTYTTALPTTTSLYTAMKRGRWANIVTTANQILGQRNTEVMYFRGGATEQGGFFFYARAGFDVWTNGGRFFAGMHTATTVVSSDPSALNNTVGFAVDAADNGAISFLTRGTSATKASTGLTITSGKGYDLFIFAAPNSSSIGWRIVDINTGTEASGTATLNLPTSTTMLTAGVLASNGALTTATATQLGINRIYVETDY